MTANGDLERRLSDFYSREPLMRAPDWVLESALSTIESRRQRRGLLAPWRFARMTTSMKLAVAAVAVVAVGAVAITQLAPPPSVPGTPTVAPTNTAPITAPPSTPEPTPSQTGYVPPPLSGLFISEMHGIHISYPAGWIVRAATEPWTTDGEPAFTSLAGDVIYDPDLGDGLFLTLASQPLGDMSFEEWSTAVLDDACSDVGPTVVDGAAGVDCGPGTEVLVSRDGRGYLIMLRTSQDVQLVGFDATDWFSGVLATVQLAPEDAVE
ncbi:MAG TPA: hypothetical protein VFP56_07755 [Candidatus Limnocylindrales bacterium]|nr:hypothetical protein [Candidatus Limnocylindrales bacterium]